MKKSLKTILFLVIILLILLIVFILYEFYTSKKVYYIDEKNIQIPIFTYHDIVLSGTEVSEDNMQTTLKNFKKQISGLLSLGYTPITYQDLIAYKNGEKAIPKRSCIITFDDGYSSVYHLVYPEIKKWNIPITIFIIDNCVGAEGYFDWDDAVEMYNSGLVSIFTHGLRHVDYSSVTPEIFSSEINLAYLNIKNHLRTDSIPNIFAYPNGAYSELSINTLAKLNFVQNLMDGKVNKSQNLDLNQLHRMYPLNDSIGKLSLKIIYKIFKY